MHPTEHRPACEVALTILHAGGKFDKDVYKFSYKIVANGIESYEFAIGDDVYDEAFKATLRMFYMQTMTSSTTTLARTTNTWMTTTPTSSWQRWAQRPSTSC